jgi:hypothetical protein
VQSFLDMCVDDDGSAICSAVYNGGALQLNLNSRFAAMYLTPEELEATVARDKLRPELVWRRMLSPECAGAYDEALCQAYFKGQNLGGEACEIVKVRAVPGRAVAGSRCVGFGWWFGGWGVVD